MVQALTLEQRTQTRGPDTFANLVSQFEQVHLISQIQSERLTDEALRTLWFYTGDGVAYGIKENSVMLYLTDFSNNPLLKHPQEAAQSLMEYGNFFVSPADAKNLEAKTASSRRVVVVNLSSPALLKHLCLENDEFSYIQVSTEKLAEGREAFKQEYGEEITALFDSVHGNAIYGANGIGKLLLNELKKETRIWILSQTWYIRNALKSQESGTMVARASGILGFGSDSEVYLGVKDVDNHWRMRGVVKETADGITQKV